MSDVMKQQLNNGFLMRPYSFFQDGASGHPTRSETLVRGWVYSMTRSEGQVCRFGYSSFAEKFGLSRSTVARITRKLRGAGDISMQRIGGQKSVYTYQAKVPATSHVRTELWLYTAIFCIYGIERRLSNAEVDVYSLIYTHTRNEKVKSYEGSIREIAGILNLSEKTVMRAIAALIAAGLIMRTMVGVNGYQKSVFVAKMKKAKTERKKAKKEERAKEREQAQLPQHVIAANSRAEREKFYADLRTRCEAQADRYKERAKSDPRYIVVERQLGALNLKLAMAEVYNDVALPTLQAEQRALQDERAGILRRLGIEEWQFDPDSFAECKECHDTGFLPDGRYCSCYRCRS